ncbi:MAG: ribonuclease J [Alphaproteobacteria bacterium]|nr:ribonuclease J [Alphaproteobacteria bacterium]
MPDLDKAALHFIPLGGAEQFGVNLNVYATQGQFLAVDCGIGFADERFPGIDLLLPDPAFLEAQGENLKGLIITHAHEDHIGGVAYLWERLECPIYTTPFTATVLRRKLEDAGVRKVPVHVVKPMDTVKIGPFSVQFVPVAHSIPDACALFIDTSHGKIVHSGDWNLDPRPVTGKPTDPAPFREAGAKGVLAYIGDSTNAAVPGVAGSESDVETGLEAQFRTCTGRIAVTIFSSNIGRIISIARAAKKSGRSVAIVGRSLHRMLSAARECGLMKGIPDFISEEDFSALPREKALMIVTGSQGEYRSALAKISRGDFRGVSLSKGDTVIFSARPIPGNDREINEVKNSLAAGGIDVITTDDTDNIIHVSGHPCRDEIAQMFQWLKPAAVIPVHGEHAQLVAQARFAKESQIETVVVPRNGSVIQLAPGAARIVDHIETGILAVDQKRIIPQNHASITERRKLQFTGALHVSLAMNARGEILGEPRLDTMGLFDEDDAAETQILDKLYEEVEEIIGDMTKEERLDDHFVAEELRIGLRRFMVHMLGFKPKTSVHVLRV